MTEVEELMTKAVVTVQPSATVIEAAKKMSDENIGTVVVVDEGKRLVGLVTDRKLTTAVLGHNRDPNATMVRDVMTSSPVFTKSDSDVCEVATKMGEKMIQRIPVVDASNTVVGIISAADIAKDHAKVCDSCSTHILDVMSRAV